MKRHILYLLYTLILLVFFGRWLSDVISIIPRSVTWLSDIIAWYLFFYSFLVKREGVYPYLWFLLTFLFIFFTSFFANFDSIYMLIPGAKFYLKYPLLAYALYRIDIPEKDYKRLFSFITILVLLQIPVSFFQRYFWFQGDSADNAGGTFGFSSTDIMCGIGAFFITYSLYVFFESKKIRFLIYALSMFLPAAFGSAKFSFLFYPFLIISLFVVEAGFSIRKMAMSVFFSSILYLVLLFSVQLHDKAYEDQESRQISSFLTDPTEKILEYEDRSARLNWSRLDIIHSANSLMQKDFAKLLIGHGPCAASSSFLGDDFAGSLFRHKGLLLIAPNFVKIWVEFGTFGLLLFVIFLLRYMFQGVVKKNSLLFGTSLTMMALSIYSRPWTEDTLSLVFWLMLCYAIVIEKNRVTPEQTLIAKHTP
jgi:hypothetical protein